MYLWFTYHKKVTVFSKCKNIQKYLEITGTTKEAYELKESSSILEFIKTEHVKELDSYGFKLCFDNKKIVYTGDTKTLIPFFPYLENCNEFYVDVSKSGGVHLKFDEIMDDLLKIKKNGTNIFLMHIDDLNYIKQVNNKNFYIS